ncbi:MAG TPA: FtsX-like permease family protein [Candidatus Binataceae bacterium]|nr:FtsX-like permease family protein [Candidatus Binataceae bacterium]
MKYLSLILKNLIRNKKRTALTVFSIAVSLFIFSALISMPTAMTQVLADTAASNRVITHNKSGLTYSIPLAYRQKIAVMPHVIATSSMSWFGGILHDVNDQFPNMAMDHEQADLLFPDWGLTPEQWDQFKKIRTACVVGADTMKRFNLHVGQQIILKGTIYPFNVTLNIVGAMNGRTQRTFIYFHRDYLEEAAGRPGFVSNIWVAADKSDNVPQLISAIDEQFANSSAETQTESESAWIGGFLRQYRLLLSLFEILGVIVVVTVGLVAANTAAMSIRERRSEIAVMRSMGFPSGTILSTLLLESLVIGILGGIIGCGGAYVALRMFSGPQLGNLVIRMPSAVMLETMVAAAVIGLLSAWIPARSASKMNIVEALRLVA